MRAIQPIAQLDRRMPRAGKIKLGIKTEKAMKALHEFRFVSPFQDAIVALADQYGGDCRPYHDDTANPPDQFECVSNATSIEVYLIPDGLDQTYEQWAGGVCKRRCDGYTVEVPMGTPDGYEMVPWPCLCMAEGERKCDPKTRLTVVLPRTPFKGGWLLETKSWNAQAEMPGMFEMISALGQGGLMRANLSIEQREEVKMGIDKKTGLEKPMKRKFVVPKLTMSESPLELQAGMAQVQAAIGAGAPVQIAQRAVATPALGAGTPSTEDDILALLDDEEMDEIEEGLRSDADQFGLDPLRFLAAMHTQAGMHVKGKAPSDDEIKDRLRRARLKMANEELDPIGFKSDGTIEWLKREPT